jgi:starch synthase
MRVAIVTPEVVPFSKTGGLADVTGALPGALRRLGVEVCVLSPLYGGVRRFPLEQLPNLLSVPMGSGRTAWGAVRRHGIFHFIEHDGFYQRPGLYGDGGRDYPDNLARFMFLQRAALEFLLQTGKRWDVVHVHDWQTALIPLHLKTWYHDAFPGVKSVLTIHNLAYQGRFWKEELPLTGFGWERFTARELEYHDDLNLLKGGLVHADALTTVSPTYAKEILTPAYGYGLDGILRDRAGALTGILNGLDGDEWDPSRDAHLPTKYTSKNLSGKAACKSDLQRRCGLPLRPEVPVLAVVGRLAEQKGVDLLLAAADGLDSREVQLVVLGTGERHLEDGVRWLGGRLGAKASIHVAFDNAFAHRIIAGADVLLVPSRYEPCGLTQIYALRYGTLPVVRSTGGLVDTVAHGVTGFRFDHATAEGLLWGVDQALAAYRAPARWVQLQRAGMAKDFSWEASAKEYLRVYEGLVRGTKA